MFLIEAVSSFRSYKVNEKRVLLAENIMDNGLIVKHEVFLTAQDSALPQRIAKAERCSLGSLIREGIIEWLARRSYLEDDQKKAFGITI